MILFYLPTITSPALVHHLAMTWQCNMIAVKLVKRRSDSGGMIPTQFLGNKQQPIITIATEKEYKYHDIFPLMIGMISPPILKIDQNVSMYRVVAPWKLEQTTYFKMITQHTRRQRLSRSVSITTV